MICPACFTSAALVVGSVTSGGGVFALLVARIRRITGARTRSTASNNKEKQS
jgi:hypothetical protein